MLILEKKQALAKQKIAEQCGCNRGCEKCAPKRRFIDLMAEANIPCAYWELSYRNFSGAPNIKVAVEDYAKNIDENFASGKCIAFAGTMGTGKTFSLCTLMKQIILKEYTTYYTSMSDMMMYLTDPQHKRDFHRLVSSVDFLCIDEVDSRHFASSDLSESFAGRTFERVIRHRIQNRLPMLIATNEARLENAFTGEFKKVVESLASINTTVVPALGKDYRLNSKR